MHGSYCFLTKDVCGRPGAMQELACVGGEGKKFTRHSTKHGASMRCQDRQPYGILACEDVQCFRNQLRDKKRSTKGFSRSVQLPRGYCIYWHHVQHSSFGR
jgi:ribosomal protein L40E